MKRRENFTGAGVSKMLCNPAYTGIRVHPSLIQDDAHKYDAELFMHMAKVKARSVGSEQCLRDFLKALRLPDDEWISLIPIHGSFAEERPALLSEEEFIRAGVQQMTNFGVITYFSNVIENLSQGIIFMAPEVKR